MSLTKQELQQLNNTNFPNNTTGYITPELLREYNDATIDSLALQTDLDALSSSVSTQLDNLNEFSSSLVTNFATVAQLNESSSQIEAQIDTLATTASVLAVSNSLYVFKGDQTVVNQNVSNTFTANNLKFNQYTQSTDLALNGKASLSQDNYFVGNQYVDGKVTVDGNISASGDIRAEGNIYGANLTGSFVSSSTFNSFSSSVQTQFSASTFFSGTQYKADSSSFSSRITNIVAGTGFVSTASFNAYTASTNSEITAIETFTASVSTSVGSLQTFSSSQYKSDSASFSSRIEGIDDDNVTTSSFNEYTSSTDSRLNSIQSFTASVSTSVGLLQTFSSSQYKSDSASFDSRIDNISEPIGYVTTASFNAYTSSNDTKVNNLTAQTASYALSASVASVDIAQDGRIESLTSVTASYAISSSVKVVTDSLQTQINGLATTSSVNTLSQSVDSRLDSLETAGYVTATITGSSLVTASVSQSTITFTKGDGSQFNITVADVSGSAGNFVTTASFNEYTSSQDFKNTTFATTSSLSDLSGSIFSTDGTQSSLINGKLDTSSFNTFSTSVDSRINAITGSSINTASFATTGSNTFTGPNNFSSSIDVIGGINMYQNGLFMGYPKNMGDPFDTNIIISTPKITGQSASGNNLILAGDTMNNKGVTILNGLDVTGSLFVAPRQVGMSTLPGNITASGDISASGNIYAANLTGSTIDTGSLVTTASFNAYTASQDFKNTTFATTGSNVFIGNQTISGSLFISGSEVVAGPVTASKLQINGITDLNGTLDVSNDATFRGDVLIQSSGEQKFKMRSTSGGGVSQGFDLLIQTSSFIIRDETHDIDFFEFDYDGSFEHVLKLKANKFELNSGSLSIEGGITASNDISTSGNIYAANLTGSGGTIDTGSFATTGSNTFNGNQIINGALQISSSATYDVDITGGFQSTAASRVSSSAGIANITPSAFTYNSNTASISSTVTKGQVIASDSTGAPSTNRYISISPNPSITGIPALSGVSVPSIIVTGGSAGTFITPIQFQHVGAYTDGRVTITTPLSASAGITSSDAFINNELYSVTSASFDSRILAITGSGGGTIDTSSFATTGSNTFIGNQTVIGVVSISSSAAYDLDITGGFQATAASRVSSSLGVSNIAATGLGYTSVTASIVSNLSKGQVLSQDSTGAPTEFKSIALQANPSVIGAPSLSGITVPSIVTPALTAGAFIAPIQFQHRSNFTDGRVTFTTPIEATNAVTTSKIIVTDTGTSAIAYQQQSTGSVAGEFATSYGKDNIKVYQYQGQPYAFNVNLTANQANAYTGSQFEWGLQLNGSNVSLPGGGGTYFAMVSGSTTGSNGDPGADKKGLDFLGTSMVLDMYADTSFRRGVFVDKGMFVSQSQGGSQRPALTVDGTSAANSRAITATGSVDITGSLTLNGSSLFAPAYGSYTGSTINFTDLVVTTYNQEFASGVENISGSFLRVLQNGIYQVNAQANFDATGGAGNISLSLKKNGTTINTTTISSYMGGTNEFYGVNTNALVQLNAFEYVEVGIDTSDDIFLGARVSIVRIA